MESCLFCELFSKDGIKLWHEDGLCYVIEDKLPVSKGHLLVISKKHFVDWFSTDEAVQHHLISVANIMRVKLDEAFSPDGYNIGINCGSVAGQSVHHVHLHLIPRYSGKPLARNECASVRNA